MQRRVGESVAYLGDRMSDVPVRVIPCITTGGDLPAGNQASVWGSLLPAAWSYMLAARARGLGTAWTTEVADILGLPPEIRQGALIPTAYFSGDGFRPAPLQPLDSVLHHERW